MQQIGAVFSKSKRIFDDNNRLWLSTPPFRFCRRTSSLSSPQPPLLSCRIRALLDVEIACTRVYVTDIGKADVSGEDVQSQELFSVLLISVHVIMFVAIIFQVYFGIQVYGVRSTF